jgi:hypothetical protein
MHGANSYNDIQTLNTKSEQNNNEIRKGFSQSQPLMFDNSSDSMMKNNKNTKEFNETFLKSLNLDLYLRKEVKKVNWKITNDDDNHEEKKDYDHVKELKNPKDDTNIEIKVSFVE